MKGDFTRDTFDQFRNFSRVLMQQGRVQLDADFNEQVGILLHYLRTLATDLGGPYWGPQEAFGFEIKNVAADGNFVIGKGRYYVDGILCENAGDLLYLDQEGFKGAPPLQAGKNYYVYLDVWERHITCIQDDRMREVALGGPDTCTRAKVVWQVKLHEVTSAMDCAGLSTWLKNRPALGNASVKVRLPSEQADENACSIPPQSRYRGAENQLYRIEIHRKGAVWDGKIDEKGHPAGNAVDAATFKWSRDNGSLVFPIVRQEGGIVTLETIGRDQRTQLKVGDWVEIMDDDHELQGIKGVMAQVDKVDPVEVTVTLKLPADVPLSGFQWPEYDEQSTNHPLLRKWDHQEIEGVVLARGAVLITESSSPDSGWVPIEDGIEIQFQPPNQTPVVPRSYRTGDYWLVPARVATGKIEWPTEVNNAGEEVPLALPPHGIEHHYAPLCVIKNQKREATCRCMLAAPPCSNE